MTTEQGPARGATTARPRGSARRRARLSAAAAAGALALFAGMACRGAGEAGKPRRAAAPPAAPAQADGTVPSADGVPIRYHVTGGGPLAVVLVHCWSCNSTIWQDTVAHLAGRYLVVTLDLAGHGESGVKRAAWTIPAFAEDVRAVVTALHLERVVLVGHSMGGYVVTEAARRMPERVVGIVPVDTLQDVAAKWDEAKFAAFVDGFRKDFKGAVRGLVSQIVAKTSDPALVDRMSELMGSAHPDIGVAAMLGLHDYDVTAALEEIKAPIHSINGDLLPTNLEGNRAFAPRFDADILPGCGHFPMFEATEAFERHLDAILAGFASPPAQP